MFVMGVDPGLAVCGYAVIEATPEGPAARSAGVIRTASTTSVAQRLDELHRDLLAVIREHRPAAMAIEQVFTNRNLQTAISVGRASGVALLAASQSGIPVYEYSPSAVKAAVAGYGKATKDQIRYAVGNRLGLTTGPLVADAADALAIALCHLQGGTGADRIAEALA